MMQSLVKILLFSIIMITPVLPVYKVKLGPHWDHRERTTCEEFGRYARFNPHTMPNETWFLFYYWAPMPPSYFFLFQIPTKQNITYLHKHLDGHTVEPVNWTANHLLMRMGDSWSFLVEQSDRGEYLMYHMHIARNKPHEHKMTPDEVRLKQTGDNKLVGLMLCKKEMTFALVRKHHLPPKHKIQEEAARLKYRSRGGKSYLYQGHHWMPIPERDEKIYWGQPHKYMYEPSSW